MGARQSVQKSLSNGELQPQQESISTSNKNSDNSNTKIQTHKSFLFSCPFLFCPPGKDDDLHTASSYRHRNVNSDAFSFGSPIPDIPDLMKRKEYYGDHNDDVSQEEKKSGSFGRGGGGYPPKKGMAEFLRSSKYIGLEKEDSSSFPEENKNSANTASTTITNSAITVSTPAKERTHQHLTTAVTAQIHDGANAEAQLYSKYTICEVLGVGSTSTCHRCVEVTSGESRACKIIDKTEIDPMYQTVMDQFYIEIKTLRSMQHPNIIQLFDVYITEDKIYIIMELMHGGELFDYVVQKGTLTEEEASRIVRKVTSALVYMHSKNVIHRDLKPENLLLTHKPRSSHDIEIKIIDFGLSKIMPESATVAHSFLGTRGYLAPEMIQRREYTKSVDAWALGVIVFVLLCGCLPFDDDCQSIPDSPDLRMKFTLKFPRWAKDLSHSAKDLLSHLLDIDSQRRYTAEQAMEHPWVRGDTASRHSLLQSPGRIKPSPGRPGKSSQATKDHVSQMVANRALANAQIAKNSPKVHVRKTSI